MFQNEKTKQEIETIKQMITEINERLNKQIATANKSYEEEDRRILRKIRDKNIDTYITIQKLEMVGLI